MAMQFEYDDKGTTFYYFLLSFFAMILIPMTYYFWPDRTKSDSKKKISKPCYCPACMIKEEQTRKKEPAQTTTKYLWRAVLVIGWALLIAGGIKVSQFEKEFIEYDPYEILKVDRGATTAEIRKQYRELSKVFHPDKETGNPLMFMKIAKAYEALTDEESRKNWEEYGNPDGPKATTFGIALPSWIVDKKNSMLVLAAYGLAFMVILPIVVGTWWYRSIQFSADEVLLDTHYLFAFYINKTPNTNVRRVLMILGASCEFDKHYNKEVQERPSDDENLGKLMRELPHLNEKNKEPRLSYPYSIKARILLHSYLMRLSLPNEELHKDLQLILHKSMYLLKDMINIVNQLTALGRVERGNNSPRLETLENIMKASGMIVQRIWEGKSQFLMLPHITQDHLRHFTSKKRSIKTLHQFVAMKNEERRMMLRNLSDDQYQDILNVCWSIPSLDVDVKASVLDETDSHIITVGSIVTVKVFLTRRSLGEFLEVDSLESISSRMDEVDDEVEESKEAAAPVKSWQNKNKRKGKKVKPVKQQAKKKQVKNAKKKTEEEAKNDDDKGDEQEDDEAGAVDPETGEAKDESDAEDSDSQNGKEKEESQDGAGRESDRIEDDDEWETLQADVEKPEAILDQKNKESHLVHAPHFPLEKYECWWVYIVDRKGLRLITPPYLVTGLKTEEEVSLRFSVPEKLGVYRYQAVIRSDSYYNMDYKEDFKIEVSAEKKFDPGAQWDFSTDEEEKGDEDSGESEFETDEETDEEN